MARIKTTLPSDENGHGILHKPTLELASAEDTPRGGNSGSDCIPTAIHN